MLHRDIRALFALAVLWLLAAGSILAEPFKAATYNLEFYVDAPTLGVPPKSETGKRLIRESIRRMDADVIALQEVGTASALAELRASLKKDGLHYPYSEHVRASDPNLHLAFLSKHPITARRHQTNINFLLQGRRFRVGRGFGEIEIEFNGRPITFITAHLKSKRQTGEADQQALREEEAALLRERIDAFLAENRNGHLVVLGDLNDGISSRTLRTVIGRGKSRLVDTHPAERNGDALPNPNPRYDPRRIIWTHFYAKEEIFSRIDYVLLSPSLERYYRPEESYVLAMPDWGAASDHRPVCVQFDF